MAFDWSNAKTRKDYVGLTKEDIIDYCKKNDKMEWLKQAMIDLKKEDEKRAAKAKADGRNFRVFGIVQLRNKFIKEVLKIGAKPTATNVSLYDEIMKLFEE